MHTMRLLWLPVMIIWILALPACAAQPPAPAAVNAPVTTALVASPTAFPSPTKPRATATPTAVVSPTATNVIATPTAVVSPTVSGSVAVAATPTLTTTVAPPSAPPVATDSPACAQVTQITPDSPEAAHISERLILALQARMEISPDVRVNEILGLARLGEWVILEASFTAELESGVFLGQDDTQRFEIVTIWGGIGTSEDVRTYLKETAPAAPPALIDCAESQGMLGSL